MKKTVLLGMIFAISFGSVSNVVFAEEIPTWVKSNAGLWADNAIDDATFVNGLQFLIKEEIIKIPIVDIAENQSNQIPTWVKSNAGLWAGDIITDSDFINSIQYLISNGIIVIAEEKTEEDTMQVTLSGDFVDGDFFHKTSGSAKITSDEDTTLLYLSDDFDTLSGPDLYVYLATDKHAKDFVDLGRLQSFSGKQTYEVSSNIDFEKYDKVLIWCEAFGVLFGNAELRS